MIPCESYSLWGATVMYLLSPKCTLILFVLGMQYSSCFIHVTLKGSSPSKCQVRFCVSLVSTAAACPPPAWRSTYPDLRIHTPQKTVPYSTHVRAHSYTQAILYELPQRFYTVRLILGFFSCWKIVQQEIWEDLIVNVPANQERITGKQIFTFKILSIL